MLTENATGAVIYAGQIDQDTIGFDGNAWDFELLVGEDGDDSLTTVYYFYVELS